MSQLDPALALRVSSEQREGARRSIDPERPRLRLVVTKGQLGVELDAPFDMGPLRVEELSLSFPHVRFPVELSGGVHTFRNRRGQLDRVRLTLSGAAAQRWATSRLRKVMASTLLHHTIAPLDDGWLVGVATERGALAFEVMLAPLDGDLRLLPTNARAVGLGEPPQALAMRVLMALVQPYGTEAGSGVVIERGPTELARALLPLAGMRAPAARMLRWSQLGHDLDGATLVAARDEAPLAIGEQVVRAVELAALVAGAERRMLAGELDDARRGYLAALTRAPRHLEIGRRLAEIDRAVGGRAEAALSILSEVQPPTDAGPLGASLLAEVGDVAGAQAAWRRAAAAEPFSPLAGHCWLELGLIAKGEAAEQALDEAIARAPVLRGARWQRFEMMVRRGRLAEARADVEHLEAQAEGAQARLDVVRRAADFLLAQRALAEASELYERALRYAPAHVESIAGLASSLSLLGHKRRALELLSRASALVSRSGQPAPRVTLDFARALAEIADDRPAAIAHVSRIEHMTSPCYEARLLEARWRAELGDLAGASASLGRLADALETVMGAVVAPEPNEDRLWSGPEALYSDRADARRALAAFAEEGARIHELDRGDLAAARRLLEVALRLAPKVASIRASFKRVAQRSETSAPPRPRESVDWELAAEEPEVSKPPTQRSSDSAPSGHPPEATPSAPLAVQQEGTIRLDDTLDGDELGDVALEARAELLSDRVRANPEDSAAVEELATVLEQLERHMELLALLSARLDEASPEERPTWLERRRALLRKMASAAEANGRDDEAQLYALMVEQD